uniref:Uncharacterized protein n=1 Tax=Romanomermis culicivorax TaxID=13658 RepID=A0A915HM35_ROMCU
MKTAQASPQTISSPINKVMKIENSKALPPEEVPVASNSGNPQFHRLSAQTNSRDVSRIRLNEPIAHVERFLVPCLTQVTNSS